MGYPFIITDLVEGDTWHQWRWKKPFPMGLPPGVLHLLPPEILAYMRTEAWKRGEPFNGGAAEDLYALGVLLYQALTDLHPFNPELPDKELVTAIATVPPTAPHLLNPLAPRSLSDIAMKLLEKRPEDRHSSTRELLQEAAQVKPPAPEDCPQEATNMMFQELGVRTASPLRAIVDIGQPGDMSEAGVYQEGPITGRLTLALSPKVSWSRIGGARGPFKSFDTFAEAMRCPSAVEYPAYAARSGW